MSIQFPISPSVNEEYAYEGKVWRWDGSAWVGVRQETGIQRSNIWAKQNLLIPNRKFGLNSGYNGATDQRRTQAGTIPALKHYIERGLGEFAFAEWTPAQITTALWLDADDASTITLNGSTVSQWNDKSGNTRDVVQVTEAKQPTRVLSGLNGKTVLSFDEDCMISTSAWVNYTNGLHFFFVLRRRTNDVDILFANRQGGGTETRVQSAFTSSTTMFHRIFGASSGDVYIGRTAPAPTINTWYIGGHLYDGGTTENSISIYENATQTDNGNDSSGIFSKQTSTSSLPLEIGSQGNQTGNILVGDYAEFIVIDSSLSTTTRQLIEGYLAHKWGLTANLPADHPYKNAAPTV